MSGASRFFHRIVGQRLTRAALTRKMKVRFFPILRNNKKGGKGMACEHKRIKSENCVIFCADCGVILPLEYLTGKKSPAPDKAAETQENGVKTEAKKTTRKKGNK